MCFVQLLPQPACAWDPSEVSNQTHPAFRIPSRGRPPFLDSHPPSPLFSTEGTSPPSGPSSSRRWRRRRRRHAKPWASRSCKCPARRSISGNAPRSRGSPNVGWHARFSLPRIAHLPGRKGGKRHSNLSPRSRSGATWRLMDFHSAGWFSCRHFVPCPG